MMSENQARAAAPPAGLLQAAAMDQKPRLPVLHMVPMAICSPDRPVSVAGEEPHTGIIAGITDGIPSVVTCVEDERLQFQVCLREIQQVRGDVCQTLAPMFRWPRAGVGHVLHLPAESHADMEGRRGKHCWMRRRTSTQSLHGDWPT